MTGAIIFQMVNATDLAKRVENVIETRFRGNVSAFGRACADVDDSVDAGNVRSLLHRHSMPRFDIVAVMAVAAGVSLDWLAGIKTPHPEEPDGATLEGQARGAVSVQLEPVPSQAVTLPGFAIGAPGSEQLIIDFLVLGKRDRRVIPFGEHVPNGNKEGR